LLVVIAIIALLVSILLPSLKNARELARTTVCQTNMRTVQMTLHMYVSEFDGHVPALRCWGDKFPGASDNVLQVNYGTAFMQLQAWDRGQPDVEPKRDDKAPWALCPSDRNSSHVMGRGNAQAVSYTQNRTVWRSNQPEMPGEPGHIEDGQAFPLSRIRPDSGPQRTSEILMFAESDRDDAVGVMGFGGEKRAQSTPEGVSIRWGYLFRHRGDKGGNVVFLDAHSEYVEWEGTEAFDRPWQSTYGKYWR
jgi:type II secretory pathway pseudopilin PulG